MILRICKAVCRVGFDKAFLGVKGFDGNGYPLSADEYEYDIKNICISNATETYLLADHTEFGRIGMYVTDSSMARNLNIITDQAMEGFEKLQQEQSSYLWRWGKN